MEQNQTMVENQTMEQKQSMEEIKVVKEEQKKGPAGSVYKPGLKRRQFIKHEHNSYLSGTITMGGLVLYVSTFSTLAAGNIIDAALLLILGIGIQVFKSNVCAALTLLYGLLNIVLAYMKLGPAALASLSIYILIVVGGYTLYYTDKLSKAWREYKKTGYILQSQPNRTKKW